VSAIPDEAPTELPRKLTPLGECLDFRLENGIEYDEMAAETKLDPRAAIRRHAASPTPGTRPAAPGGDRSPEGSARSAGGSNDLDLNRIAV
jgi:hypothetical protein